MHDQYNTEGGSRQPPETLRDVSLTGRVRPWRQHKLESELLAEAYSIGAKSFSCYYNLLRAKELKVRVIDGRGKVLRVYSEARPP